MCRHGPPELVIRCKHSVIPVPMLARRRDEIGEPVQELKRRELDDAVRSRSRRLAAATGSDPVRRPMSRQHVADASDLAVCTAAHGEPLEREGWPGAIPQQVLQAPKIARHVAVDERDPNTGIARLPRSRRWQVLPPSRPRKHRPAGGEQRGPRRRHRKAGNLPHTSAFLRHAPPGGGIRHPHRSGVAGAQRRPDDDDLRARAQSWRPADPEPG